MFSDAILTWIQFQYSSITIDCKSWIDLGHLHRIDPPPIEFGMKDTRSTFFTQYPSTPSNGIQSLDPQPLIRRSRSMFSDSTIKIFFTRIRDTWIHYSWILDTWTQSKEHRYSLILSQNTPKASSKFKFQDPSLFTLFVFIKMTTRPSRQAPSSLLTATKASSARKRTSPRLAKAVTAKEAVLPEDGTGNPKNPPVVASDDACAPNLAGVPISGSTLDAKATEPPQASAKTPSIEAAAGIPKIPLVAVPANAFDPSPVGVPISGPTLDTKATSPVDPPTGGSNTAPKAMEIPQAKATSTGNGPDISIKTSPAKSPSNLAGTSTGKAGGQPTLTDHGPNTKMDIVKIGNSTLNLPLKPQAKATSSADDGAGTLLKTLPSGTPNDKVLPPTGASTLTPSKHATEDIVDLTSEEVFGISSFKPYDCDPVRERDLEKLYFFGVDGKRHDLILLPHGWSITPRTKQATLLEEFQAEAHLHRSLPNDEQQKLVYDQWNYNSANSFKPEYFKSAKAFETWPMGRTVGMTAAYGPNAKYWSKFVTLINGVPMEICCYSHPELHTGAMKVLPPAIFAKVVPQVSKSSSPSSVAPESPNGTHKPVTLDSSGKSTPNPKTLYSIFNRSPKASPSGLSNLISSTTKKTKSSTLSSLGKTRSSPSSTSAAAADAASAVDPTHAGITTGNILDSKLTYLGKSLAGSIQVASATPADSSAPGAAADPGSSTIARSSNNAFTVINNDNTKAATIKGGSPKTSTFDSTALQTSDAHADPDASAITHSSGNAPTVTDSNSTNAATINGGNSKINTFDSADMSPLDLDLDTLPPSKFDDPPLPAKGPVFLKHLDVEPLEDYINWAVKSLAAGGKPSNELVKVTQYKPRDISHVRAAVSYKWCKLLEVPFEGMVDPTNKWNPNFLRL